MAPVKVQNKVNQLTWSVPIVNANGTPTDEFMRKWLQQATQNASVVDLTTAINVSKVLDLISSVIGAVMVRGATQWTGLVPVADGRVLRDKGVGAVPIWDTISDVLDVIGSTRGSLLYRGVAGWAILAPSAAGKVLTDGGAGADPSWQPSTGGSGGGAASIQDDGTTVYLAISDGDGQLVLDGAGDPIFMPEIFPLSAIPTPMQPTVQKFLTPGTFAYTPPVGCVRLEVLLKASGGGSCGLGTSGSGNGGNGADAIFNGIHAAAGQGGSASTGAQAAGGTGGTGTAVDRKAGAAAGSPFMLIWTSTTFVICGGQGGGQGGGPGLTGGVGGAGNPGVANSGGGAGGPLLQNATQAVIAAYNFAGSGAEGEEALVVVNNPTGTYSLTVPDGGTAGAAGVAGFAGAKGGSGRVIVREFYS